ncbi:MAG: hypothetical protein A2289_19455 [Deltaproteobacteria bacterium RIFOXYA12_FULL_58_15]|nr:MAG: hypothetical protein A2289_19455 [Deltaproteobacteria bacterium RIFOXYA12_FULL_58_15]
MLSSNYGFNRSFSGLSLEQAKERIVESLKKEGFGILTEIDVKATMKKKLDVDVRPYVILGACNPALAHKALKAEPAIGLLLPCNVVVAETDDGAEVAIAKPEQMFKIVDNPGVRPLAKEVTEKLVRALENA